MKKIKFYTRKTTTNLRNINTPTKAIKGYTAFAPIKWLKYPFFNVLFLATNAKGFIY